MLSLVARQSLYSRKTQIPISTLIRFNQQKYIHTKTISTISTISTIQTHLHINSKLYNISCYKFSWSSEETKRSTATKPVPSGLPELKGAEAEYPTEWDPITGTKKQKIQKRIGPDGKEVEDTYLEEEYFGDKSPVHDFQGLIKPKLPNLDKKETLTPLAEEIKQMIHARGPITLSTFWRLCMQHPTYGYYMTKDPIGREGDFITTPEIFSGFSECLAVWCAFTWESMGKPPKIKIIEYGPGLGTVTKTIMDIIRKPELKPFKDSISFHMIETSSRLRWKQKTKLGLGNIRKFKMRVKKPIYAVTDISPYATVNDNKKKSSSSSSASTSTSTSTSAVSSENYHQDPFSKTNLIKDNNYINISKSKDGITPLSTDPNIPKLDPSKRKINPIVAPKVSDEFKTRDDIPPELLEPTKQKQINKKKTSSILTDSDDNFNNKIKSNPFKTDRIFGEMSGKALNASGLSGDMTLTDDIKNKFKPFDWSLHHPDIFGHVDEEMKPYVTGQKSREWDEKHSQIKVERDPLQKSDDNNDKTVKQTEPKTKTKTSSSSSSSSILTSSSSSDGIKTYNEPLSAYSSTSTIPPRQTKRDIESNTKYKTDIGYDDNAYSELKDNESTNNNNTNPFKPILDKLEQEELIAGVSGGSGGTIGANLDFSDLMDHDTLHSDMAEEMEEIWQARTKDGILVSWHNSLHSVDSGTPALFLCHEFFDALPISHFEFRAHGWVETVVDVNDNENELEHFKLIRGPVATFASEVLDRQFMKQGIKPGVGQQFCISPEGNEIMNHIAKYISSNGGAGFVIDYGDSNPPPWSVQGIKDHKPHNPLSYPGDVDISSHVNFNALSASINNVSNVKAFGPVTQSYFLQGCGIVQRFRQYIKDEFDSKEDKNSDENIKKRQDFFNIFAKIMDIDKLGGHFKVLGFTRDNFGVPVGFRSPLGDKQAKVDEMGIPVYEKLTQM